MVNEKPHIRLCPICQKELAYREVSERNRKHKNNVPCRSCSNSLRGLNNYYEDIPVAWFNGKLRRAKQRDYEFTITIDYIWDIYIAQDKVCALSGVPICFKDSASLDRVDNSKGYVH